ncbi:MAG: glycosyltransferase [Lachnospiraceae bacterium]|nr:glycosyltransferase [Lachnospiraceae bacterium]
MSEKKPVLSISMLVSNNRRDTIEKCMESLVPLRKSVPSELIIVDTGCTDGSVEIAEKYADKVVRFPWCNDFSAARNAGLRECSGEWFLYLDDDEWFEDVTELTEFFRSEERKRYDALWYLQRNYDNFEGTTWVDTYAGRAAKLTPETRFCGKIHEVLEPLPKMKMIKKTKAYVHHYGYVYKSEEDRQKHMLRNFTLLEEAVREHPEDIRICCQLVQEYRAAERWEDAERLCETTLKHTKYAVTNSFVQFLLVTLPKIYREKEAYAQALAELERIEREETRLHHQTKLVLFYEKAVVFGKTKREQELQQACMAYLEEYEKDDGENAEGVPTMDFAEYISPHLRQRVVRFGIRSMLRSGEYTFAERFFEAADWNEGNELPEMVAALFLVYSETCERSESGSTLLRQNLPRVLRNKDLETNVFAELWRLWSERAASWAPGKREEFLADLESLGLRSGNFSYFHLLFTEEKKITTPRDLADYYEKSDRKYDAEVSALLFWNAELFPRVSEMTSFEDYAEGVSLLLAEKDEAEVEELWQRLPEVSSYYPEAKMNFWKYAVMAAAGRRMLLEAERTENTEAAKTEIRARLETYIAAVKQYYGNIAEPQTPDAESGILPDEVRFARAMEDVLSTEEDRATWGERIKQIAKEYPPMLPVLRALLKEEKERREQNTQNPQRQQDAQNTRNAQNMQNAQNGESSVNSAQKELLALAAQLKAIVRKQLSEGKTKEANAILAELAVMLPDDEEVKELLKGVRNK